MNIAGILELEMLDGNPGLIDKTRNGSSLEKLRHLVMPLVPAESLKVTEPYSSLLAGELLDRTGGVMVVPRPSEILEAFYVISNNVSCNFIKRKKSYANPL